VRRGRPGTLGGFFGLAVAWLVALTALWVPVSKWTSYPAALLGGTLLEAGSKHWVRAVHVAPGRLAVETSIRVPVEAQGRRGIGEIVAETNPALHAYGLPLFLALLLASRSRRFVRRALAGYALLLVPQAFSLTLDLLRQMAMAAPGGAAQLEVAPWRLEAIALGYQLGSLLLPTLVPVALWLWFDRTFFVSVLLQGWMARQVARRSGAEKSEPA
jgi:hypothetical protein